MWFRLLYRCYFRGLQAQGVEMGSIGGGGRYNNQLPKFSEKRSRNWDFFWLDRIYLVIEELNLFPQNSEKKNRISFCQLWRKEAAQAMKNNLAKLREKELLKIYPESAKLKKNNLPTPKRKA